MTQNEIEAIAEAAAEKTVAKFLTTLGMDTSDPLKMQAIFLHVERQYDACQIVKQHSLKTAIGVVMTAIIGYVLLIFGFPKIN